MTAGRGLRSWVTISWSAGGPSLLSYLAPSAGRPEAGEQVLVQHLSLVPPELVSLWVEAFARDVREPRYWDREHLGGFMLKIRTLIAVFAKPFAIGAKAAERYIEFKKALGGT